MTLSVWIGPLKCSNCGWIGRHPLPPPADGPIFIDGKEHYLVSSVERCCPVCACHKLSPTLEGVVPSSMIPPEEN